MSLPLVEFILHIIHVIPSDKMTALQTEHVHNSVGVTEARAVARS